MITRHEKPVARIVPEGGRDSQQGKKAAAGLLAAVAAGAGLEELRLLPLACEDGPLLAAARKAALASGDNVFPRDWRSSGQKSEAELCFRMTGP